MRIVAALGGNALLHRDERPCPDVVRAGIERAVESLAVLARDNDLVITHGNGPELGTEAVDSAAGPPLGAPRPLDMLGAQSQGMIGSLLVRSLRSALPGRPVTALVTHTLVDPGDPAFERPGTFVGQVYPRDIAQSLARKHGWHIARDTAGWRRTVPCPEPEAVLETDVIHALLNSGAVVVCGGGGGVPVTTDADTGRLNGVEAVVDTDLTAALLAEELKADFLLLLTDVPNVYTDFGTPRRQPLLGTTPDVLRSLPLPEGSMRPKAEAAARFVERTGGPAAIGALGAAYAIAHGTTGTLVCPRLAFG
ncbi:carbamate kinase [Streptomyces sp. NPDC048566]|uniref:amino acid kinase family protein n=1 Tax=Streptomyces sp. NPDC048566 TaxID=3365569 RepID=UPI00371DA17A